MGTSAVIGGGAWGTALALQRAGHGDLVRVWAYEASVVEDINSLRENRTFLPGVSLPENLTATGSLPEALSAADLVFIVCPSHVMRPLMRDAAAHVPPGVPLISAAKGIENETLMVMSEVLEDVLPRALHPMLTFLSGPSFAKEVAHGMPTAVCVAARDEDVAVRVQETISTSTFRVYTSNDVIGVELGGALKNVLAIAAGAADGLGFGMNTSAALITRGLAEMSRLALKRGANPMTLAGLAGMGDLVLTCNGSLSRNRLVGQKLGQGLSLDQIVSEMRQVAEGVKTAKAAHLLAQREGVELPICTAVYRMLYEGLSPRAAVSELMSRSLKKEMHGL
ncbi:MAG: NAD(P)-dependent glycerol-3-phosphate dehydrogenase [Myxococcales bacterium]|nr:NAD(P)-dependent glycerol-3-phosphate dehydrogenase [Myxococcales bacterium]